MMWLFWQVFLLCLASFLVGGLLSWALLVRPLAARRAVPQAVAAPVPVAVPAPAPVPRAEVVEPETAKSEAAEPEAEFVGPLAEKAEPVAEKAQPVAERAEPVAEETEPVEGKAEPAEPVAETTPAPKSELILPVKGNSKTKRYHTEDSPYFARTKGDVWFATVADAEQAGYTSGAKRKVPVSS
ncbi:hypothetical protein JOF53_000895 [Crossiella equi]|uniref:Uncharacterized protein n=1 Tax=Crossiella equi TaxID=130796 RepID=A0ABS5A603_9PSEU|nr:hypothetical protein [Crossiella equi]MBP2472023.1 hypothetical protein [Crossiella equi]